MNMIPSCRHHREGLTTSKDVVCWCTGVAKSGLPAIIWRRGGYGREIEKVCINKAGKRYLHFTKEGKE